MQRDPTPNNEDMAVKRHDFGFRRITDYSAEELDLAIRYAKEDCGTAGLDFYAILRGVDAYMEKRRRKDAARSK